MRYRYLIPPATTLAAGLVVNGGMPGAAGAPARSGSALSQWSALLGESLGRLASGEGQSLALVGGALLAGIAFSLAWVLTSRARRRKAVQPAEPGAVRQA